MRYEVSETLGECIVLKTYDGTPNEIYEFIKLQENQTKAVCSKLSVTINGDIVAERVRTEIERALERFESSKMR